MQCKQYAYFAYLRIEKIYITSHCRKNSPQISNTPVTNTSVPYPDITGDVPRPTPRSQAHIHGRPKCQISLKLACFYPCHHHLKFSTLLDAAWHDIYGHLWSIMSNTIRCNVRPACEATYGRIRFLPVSLRPACEATYGRIRSLPLCRRDRPREARYSPIVFFSPMAQRVVARHAALTNHHHSYHCAHHTAYDSDW